MKTRLSQGAIIAVAAGVAMMFAASTAIAQPQYMDEIGASNCGFCHIGKPGNKNFNRNGQVFYQKLVREGRITPPRPPCRVQTINLYDMHGNLQRRFTHCVP